MKDLPRNAKLKILATCERRVAEAEFIGWTLLAHSWRGTLAKYEELFGRPDRMKPSRRRDLEEKERMAAENIMTQEDAH